MRQTDSISLNILNVIKYSVILQYIAIVSSSRRSQMEEASSTSDTLARLYPSKNLTPHHDHLMDNAARKKERRDFGGTVNRTRAGADLDRNTMCSPATTRRHTTRLERMLELEVTSWEGVMTYPYHLLVN